MGIAEKQFEGISTNIPGVYSKSEFPPSAGAAGAPGQGDRGRNAATGQGSRRHAPQQRGQRAAPGHAQGPPRRNDGEPPCRGTDHREMGPPGSGAHPRQSL